VLEVMHACVRRGRGEAALKLFDQMSEKGAVASAHLINKTVSDKFFQLVAEALDDERIQTDGLWLLDLVRAHGIDPSPSIQKRVLVAWGNQCPESVLEYFLKLKRAGVTLSRWVYHSIVVAHERSDPEFALKTYFEMEELGIKLTGAAYNAVLGACAQLGMHDEARELFMKMVDHAVAPNAKTFGVMMKVYSSSNQLENAIALFEAMREQSLEPDRYAYHYAICSCITLKRMAYAGELFEDVVQKKVPLCTSTCDRLSGACRNIGRNSLTNSSLLISRGSEDQILDLGVA